MAEIFEGGEGIVSKPWMPLYIGDYLRDTRHLNAAEHGAYLLLIMQYWTSGSLPDDDQRLARIACMTEREWHAAKPIIAEFFDEGWKHPRIEQEMRDTERLSARGRAGGAASGTTRRTRTPKFNEQEPPNSTNKTPTKHEAPQPQSQEEDGMVDARARDASLFTPGSRALAEAFRQAVGFNDPLDIPPEFAGIDYRAIEWERVGWNKSLVFSEAKRLALDQPNLKPIAYFEKVFATAFAKQNAPAPVVKFEQPANNVVTHGKTHARSGSLIAAIDREIAGLEAEEGADLALPQGAVLRLSD